MPHPQPPSPAPLTARQFLDAGARDFRAVPAAALRFAADVTAAAAVSTDADPRITILARTGEPINHYYWGRAVHDMAGFVAPPSAVPLDYCHDDSEILGFGDQFTPQPAGLTVRGRLTPFTATDRAAEVASKMPRGVPYQASISFPNDGLAIEELPPGVTAEVNGYALIGPAVIFRRWTVRGVAICPYGYDAGTVAAVDPADLTTPPATRPALTQPQDPTMPTAQPIAAPAATNLTATAEAPPTTPVNASAPTPEPIAAEAVDPETEEEAAETPATDPATPPATNLAAGRDYIDAYGPQGAVWFIEGKTPAEAARLFGQQQQSEAARLTRENADLRAQVTSLRGEAQPLHVDAQRTEQAEQATQLAAKLGSDNVARVVAGIKLPGKK